VAGLMHAGAPRNVDIQRQALPIARQAASRLSSLSGQRHAHRGVHLQHL
jgi:hypothetical protein